MFDKPDPLNGTTAAFVSAAIAEVLAPPEKRPLYRQVLPSPRFPIEALGPLQSAATAIQQLTQAPIAIAAQSVLAAATLAAQAQRDVVLPAGGQKPLTGIFVSVAESGERKSSVDRLALSAVYQVEQEWRQEAERDRPRYCNEKAAWDAARERAKREAKGNMSSLMAAFENIGPEPKPPQHPMLLIADPTPEALIMHLEGRPVAGVFTAEGGILIGGAAFKDESRMRTAALLNILWDGEPIRRRRVGTGSSFLPGRRCSAHIMLQPVIANELFGDAMLDGMGLTARMLLVAPESTAGSRLFREPEDSGALSEYNERIRYLLTRPPATKGGMPDELAPPAMMLSPDAKVAWIKFHDICEQALQGGLAQIRAAGAKLAEHAGRLAATIALFGDPDVMTIEFAAMESGIALATHYGCEMLRLHGGASVRPELRAAQLLLDWWQTLSDPAIHLAMIYQRGPAALRDAKAARRAVEVLATHDWIERIEPGAIIDGAARKEAWRLRP